MVTFLVGVALPQRLAHPVERFVVKGQPPEQISELLFEHLFTDVGLVAFPLVAGAVVVDVPLLDLGDDRAAAMAASDQTGESELVLGAAMALGVAAVENVLHPFPQLARHDRLVATLIDAAVPLELAHVDARAQHWSGWVRDALVWCGETDPVATMERTREDDPKLEALSNVVHQREMVIGEHRVSTSEVIDAAKMTSSDFDPKAKNFVNGKLREALLVVAGDGGAINSRRLGKWLGSIKGRIVNGKRIVADGTVAGVGR